MSPVPRYRDDRLTLYHGDCLEVLAELPDASIDSIVTDPPYEMGFMGRRWDASGIAYNVDLWKHGVAHPTVKPLDLMRWLVRLVTPPSGVVLDPFAGSGTTAQAAALESMCCVTIEREAAYLTLIAERLGITLETVEAESAPVEVEDRSTWTPERWMDHFLSGAS